MHLHFFVLCLYTFRKNLLWGCVHGDRFSVSPKLLLKSKPVSKIILEKAERGQVDERWETPTGQDIDGVASPPAAAGAADEQQGRRGVGGGQ